MSRSITGKIQLSAVAKTNGGPLPKRSLFSHQTLRKIALELIQN